MTTRPYSCIRKRQYRTEYDASQALLSMQATGFGSTLTIYPCEHCAHFHIGNKKLYCMNFEQLLAYTEDLEEQLEQLKRSRHEKET